VPAVFECDGAPFLSIFSGAGGLYDLRKPIYTGLLFALHIEPHIFVAELIGGLVLIVISSILIKITYPKNWHSEARDKVSESVHRAPHLLCCRAHEGQKYVCAPDALHLRHPVNAYNWMV
jgi:hypothetical protein